MSQLIIWIGKESMKKIDVLKKALKKLTENFDIFIILLTFLNKQSLNRFNFVKDQTIFGSSKHWKKVQFLKIWDYSVLQKFFSYALFLSFNLFFIFKHNWSIRAITWNQIIGSSLANLKCGLCPGLPSKGKYMKRHDRPTNRFEENNLQLHICFFGMTVGSCLLSWAWEMVTFEVHFRIWNSNFNFHQFSMLRTAICKLYGYKRKLRIWKAHKVGNKSFFKKNIKWAIQIAKFIFLSVQKLLINVSHKNF